MNKKELINVPRILFPVGTEVLIKGKIVGLKALDDRFVENVVKLAYGEQITAPNDAIYVKDEPETGHADEAPRYVKNILARLRELPLHDREVWLKAIMGEFEKDFSHAKWREGHEVEKEPKYTVKFKATNQYLCDDDGIGLHISPSFRSNFRKSDLEKLSLTEVFDSPLFEVVEVE